ncbi:hypothetical protein LPJ38_11345 [Bradyrhizobium daqingense]|uniref:Uncharacterized protein n=1 Tax=Bradyrhizobium daqingense TaxID=993502 RepID=A0A562LDB8_9BRAD|nr:hypothetical protein [Bradyrhizobium daqingense]TWI05641.1 hypothetical protein IQ17_03141 [Bradyrhizobium daqingense]UFS91288.1 hypothetical protein LPJ38_11345 [Bradyrhizobium daqingense]
MPVKFNDILEALEFANTGTGGGLGDFRAFVCKQTAEIYYQTNPLYSGELDDELPDDIENEDKYIPLPDKRDLDLGKPLVLAFAREFLPDDFDDVRYFFSKRGAYPKFKALLARRRAIERWHAFEKEATEQALREWCALHSIEIIG